MNHIIEWFSDLGRASFSTFAVSVAAIIISVWAMIISRRTQKRSLAIEEARERDRNLAMQKATLVASLVREPTGDLLRIENRGQAEARDVSAVMDGHSILEHSAVYADTEICQIGPDSHIQYLLVFSLDNHPPFELEITWTDDSGEQGHYRTTLT